VAAVMARIIGNQSVEEQAETRWGRRSNPQSHCGGRPNGPDRWHRLGTADKTSWKTICIPLHLYSPGC